MKFCRILLFPLFACVFSAQARPNLIVVMADDMGYGDLGATGNPVIRTPNLDRFATESASLSNYYVCPVCSPTRAGLMTGRHNYRTRCIDTFKGRSMMDPGEVTIAEMLGQAGYATGIFGKWHLGDNYPLRPQDQGFDEVLIHRGGGLAQPSEPIENHNRYTDPILFHNGRQVQTKGFCTDVYFDAAIRFMKDSREAGKPFFVYLPTNAPHGPYHDVPADLLAYYQSIDLTPALNGNDGEKHRDTVARVYAMVENIDQNMGKLDAWLKASGQYDDTLVLFFTDNGPNTPRYAGPFRGMKSHVHEGGVHTMFFARWPERLQAGTSSDRIAANIDVAPTLLAAAGVEPPADAAFDGRNVLPLLTGKDGDWPERTIFFQCHRGNEPSEFHNFAVREQEWKLVRNSGFGRETAPDDAPFELFRISEDPGEANDLAGKNPEKVEAMKKAYLEWFAGVSSTRPDNYAPPRIVIGSAAEPRSDLSIQDWRVDPNAPGWGAEGRWVVTIADPGPYQAALRWTGPIGAREVVLHVGGKRFEGSLAAGKSEVNFDGILLPEGDAEISVEVSGKVKPGEAIRFVTLEKKNAPRARFPAE